MNKRVREKIQEKRGSSMGSSFECKCLALPSGELLTVSTTPWALPWWLRW